MRGLSRQKTSVEQGLRTAQAAVGERVGPRRVPRGRCEAPSEAQPDGLIDVSVLSLCRAGGVEGVRTHPGGVAFPQLLSPSI